MGHPSGDCVCWRAERPCSSHRCRLLQRAKEEGSLHFVPGTHKDYVMVGFHHCSGTRLGVCQLRFGLTPDPCPAVGRFLSASCTELRILAYVPFTEPSTGIKSSTLCLPPRVRHQAHDRLAVLQAAALYTCETC